MAPLLPPVLPEGEEVRKLLADLVGKPVALKAAPGPPRPNAAPQVQAVYVTDEGDLHASCSIDLALSANLGAALAMMPPSAAQDALKWGRLNDLLVDCAREVLNVMSRLFNRAGGVQVVVGEVVVAPAALKPDARARLQRASLQREFEFEVQGYGRGRIVIRIL